MPKAFTGRRKEIWDLYVKFGTWLTAIDTHALVVFCTIAEKAERDWYQVPTTEKVLLYDLMSTLGLHPLARGRLAQKRHNVSQPMKKRQPKEKPEKANGHGHQAKDDKASSYFDD